MSPMRFEDFDNYSPKGDNSEQDTQEENIFYVLIRSKVDWEAEGIITKLVLLLGLKEGWDSYDASQIQPRAIEKAIELLLSSPRGHETPSPQVVPTSEGGLQLEWHEAGADLEIMVSPIGHLTGFWTDGKTSLEREGDTAVLDLLNEQAPRSRLT